MKRISVLMATAFVDMIGFAILFPLLPFYAERLNADPWIIGWLIASFSISQLLVAPAWGRFSDRYGRRPALLLGLSISAVAFLLFAFAGSIWMLFLTRVVQGVGGGTTGVAQAYVADSTEPAERAKALGWLSAATSAGVMFGPVIGSLVFNLGVAAPGLVAASLCVINVAFALRWLPESRSEPHSSKQKAPTSTRSIRETRMEFLRNPRGDLARLVWIYAVGMLGFMSMTAVLPLYLGDAFGVTERTIGAFFFFVGLMSIIMRAVILGRMVDRFGETRVMRMGAFALAIGLFAIPIPDSLVLAGLAMVFVPIGTALLFPSVSALVSHRTPKGELGQMLGVQQQFGGVARVAAPLWATAVYQTLGITTPFFIASMVVVFVSFLTFGVKAEDADDAVVISESKAKPAT